MKYVRLGNTGLQVSRICLGCMSFGSPAWANYVVGEEESLPLIKYAWDAGINFFDTANAYSQGYSEVIVGHALTKYQIPRDRVVIATKVYFPVYPMQPEFAPQFKPPPRVHKPLAHNRGGLSRKAIMQEVDASLKRLGTDYIDLYQTHRWDYDTPIEEVCLSSRFWNRYTVLRPYLYPETLLALHDLVRSGKVRYLGTSSMWAWQLSKANYTAKLHGLTPFVSMQNFHNALYREEERLSGTTQMMPLVKDQGMASLRVSSPDEIAELPANKVRAENAFCSSHNATDTWLGLGGVPAPGNRFAKDDRGAALADVDEIINRVDELSKKHKQTMSSVALAWSLSKDFVTAPIVGVSKKKYIDDAVRAVGLKLSPEEVKYIDAPSRTLQGIDAGASVVDIIFDAEDLFAQVSDDGVGIRPDDLKLVGQRYRELQNIGNFLR
ncbi:hypothetical protein HDU93_004497 [Gonapodya sp. JEL0774]|nr:hypothetical protein HDU93_004497 [Gonapodya sp. JEL0774]